MFWNEIIIKACKKLKIGDKIEASNEKLQLEVGYIARDVNKKHEPRIQLKIHNIMELRKDNFEKISKGVYRLKDESDKKLADDCKKENKNLLDLKKQLDNLTWMSEHEKWAIVKQRIGQGAFRKQLMEKWKGCSVTGYEQSEILVASHIKPWSESSDEEKLDTNNGLLLVANLDKAFDQGLITFEDNGNIRISDDLENPEKIDIKQDMKLTQIFKESKKYLEYHREEVYEKQ